MDEDIQIDLTPNSNNTSKNNPNRRDLLWDKREENIFKQWVAESKKKIEFHQIKAKSCKIKNACLSIPAILIPIVSSGLAGILPCNSMENSILMMIVGILNCIDAFFDYGRRREKHEVFSNRYFTLVNEVESELTKPKKDRIACDVYMEKIKQNYNTLHLTEPS